MDKNEIERYLTVSRNRCIIVDRKLLDKYDLCVRDTVIMDHNKIKIEINNYGYEDGGIDYYFQYSDLDAIIKSLEAFLGKPISEWINVNKDGYYPDLIKDEDNKKPSFAEDFLTDSIDLPQGFESKYLSEGYWKDLYEERKRSRIL